MQRISATYVQARNQSKKRKLAWRKSGGVRRSFGWVPFNTGHVSSKAMIKTNMAKSALDAGWSSLKRTLEYKCVSAGVIYKEVNEANSTRAFQGACSVCGALSGPKGLKDLLISGPRRGNGAESSVEARTIVM